MPAGPRAGYAAPPGAPAGTKNGQTSATGWSLHPSARSALILALSLAFVFGVVRPFGAEAFRVTSGSMAPTLRAGDHVLVDKLAYRMGDPRRGDLVAFRGAGGGVMIKRAVGLPGDTVAVRDGVLYVNGTRVVEPYVNYGLNESNYFGPVRVPGDHVFVMGDHRENSRDSREFGPVRRGDLIGRVALRVWPVGGP
ncbi:MAG TPA: signal peptidase I [Rubrobacter sp.]|nr:signal peptidase I [Rubrobacter sp.]